MPVTEADVVDVEPQEGPLTLLEIFQWPQMALCRLCGLFQAVGAAVSAAQHACLFRLENIINHRRFVCQHQLQRNGHANVGAGDDASTVGASGPVSQ